MKEAPRSEGNKEQRLRKSKTYNFNAWEALENEQVVVTWAQLAQICPTARRQLKEGLSEQQPGFEIKEIRSAQEEDDDKTSMYATCHVEGRQAKAVIDSGAGSCIISAMFLDLLGWGINEPTKINFIMADGVKVQPLGVVKDIPIRFGNFTINVDAYVSESRSYDLIIGNTWLNKANAVIDYNAQELQLTWRGRQERFPVDIERGVRPRFEEKAEPFYDEEDPEEEVVYAFERTKYTRDHNVGKPPRPEDGWDFSEEPETAKERQGWHDSYKKATLQFWDGSLTDWTNESDIEWEKEFGMEIPSKAPTKARTNASTPEVVSLEEIQYWGKQNANPAWDAEDEWTKAVEPPKFHSITPEVIPSTAVARICEKNFKNRGCKKHGAIIRSPSDQCSWCVIEAWKEDEATEFIFQFEKQNRNPDPTDERSKYRKKLEPLERLKFNFNNEQINVLVLKKDPTIGVPIHLHEGNAGFDLVTTKTITLTPGESQIVPSGLAFQIPQGFYGQIKPRSGMARLGLTVDGGVIDSNYTGQVHIILVNRNHHGNITVNRYERVVQILFIPVLTRPLKLVDRFPVTTTRGEDGFGSTGIFKVIAQRKQMVTNEEEKTKAAGKHTYKLGADLNPNQEERIRRLFTSYEDNLAIEFDQIQKSKIKFTHKVNTEGNQPIKSAPYRAPVKYRDWMRKEIAEMEKAGIIRKSSGPWASPIVIVPKKTGDPENPFSPRMCVDYRKLNKVTKKDAYPIPLIKTILDEVKGNYFSTFDLYSGYNQIPMHPVSWENLVP